MTQAELKILLNKYTEGTLNTEEQARLDQWYLYQARNGKSLNDAAIYEKRMLELNEALFPDQDEEPKRIKLWPRIAVAAAAVAAITLGVWLYYASSINGRHPDAGQDPGLAMNDIAPGKNTATLTLADGKIIPLDTNRSSVVVTDSVKTMTMLTASTPRGGTYQVMLPDGTKVWLNADSKISFPSQFTGKERKILLEGEAYFEVAKVLSLSSQRKMLSSPESTMPSTRQIVATRDLTPFIVESASQKVEVLGTHFNVKAYKDEKVIRTTLLEGSVSVSEGERLQLLEPGYEAINSSGSIQVKKANTEEAIAWKQGLFQFDRADIKTVMTQLARWYDVEVEYEGALPEREFTGKIYRNVKASQALELLKNLQVNFRIEGRKIIVTK